MKTRLQLTIESREDIYKAFDTLCAAEAMFTKEEPIEKEQPMQEEPEETEELNQNVFRMSGWHLSDETKQKIGEKIVGRLWYNDGEVNVRRYEQPGPRWRRGQIRHN